MIRQLLCTIRNLWRWLTGLPDLLVDSINPEGWVELRLIYADGPLKGQVYRVIEGHNVVTSWLSSGGIAPTSGRDLLRRVIVPAEFPGSLADDEDAVVGQMKLGSGTTAEVATDTDLVSSISGTEKDLDDVEFDTSNPYVTFVVTYGAGEANQTLSEVALLSRRGDFMSRKTFSSFAKTSEFDLEVRWTYRF